MLSLWYFMDVSSVQTGNSEGELFTATFHTRVLSSEPSVDELPIRSTNSWWSRGDRVDDGRSAGRGLRGECDDMPNGSGVGVAPVYSNTN